MSQEQHGQCSACHAFNLYSASTCRHCNARLPWADALSANQQITLPQTAQWTPAAMPLPPQFCAHCGCRHAHGAAFCASCGTPSEVRMQQAPALQPLAPPVQQIAPQSIGKNLFSHFLVGQKDAAANVSQAPGASALNSQFAAPGYMMPFPVQQNVNVSVVTHQETRHKKGSGLWARLMLFLFKSFLVLAFLYGVLAVLFFR